MLLVALACDQQADAGGVVKIPVGIADKVAATNATASSSTAVLVAEGAATAIPRYLPPQLPFTGCSIEASTRHALQHGIDNMTDEQREAERASLAARRRDFDVI